MSQLMKRGRVQLQLPLELVSVQPHPLEHVRSEAIEVLADLLLEAMGPEETPLGTVQALLGHSSSEITRETYIHSVPADARRAVSDVEKLFGPKWTQVPKVLGTGSTLIN
jgi:integrase